jgi:hypothetical protein
MMFAAGDFNTIAWLLWGKECGLAVGGGSGFART